MTDEEHCEHQLENLIELEKDGLAVSPGLLFHDKKQILRDSRLVEKVMEWFCRKYNVANYDYYWPDYDWGDEE